ncbi:gpW family head-tail joining protein [uncultured Cohaesibacter sp.]|uniref:gpW family head-tail joining protein n=1 Tax=uncultured Cohaesibacter sp. TaxID=1002546 RepID=UPI0029C64AB4|nr:gpW family head-tail joining protein [uncultured Cohaesibacter sp.]
MADKATLETQLAEAEETLHKLLTGQLEREMSQNGKSASFSLPKVDDLKDYIKSLKRQLGLPIDGPHRNKRVYFG